MAPRTDRGPQIGRLALREEGTYWNAYYAMPHTMEGAHLLGSIRMSLIMTNDGLKEQFMALMQHAVGDVLKEISHGNVVEWGDREKAPEHERPGHG